MSKRAASPAIAETVAAKLAKTEDDRSVKEEQEEEAVAAAPVKREVVYPRVMYKDGEPLPGLQEIYENSPDKIAEVVIPAEYMNNNNRRVKTRQLWGDRIYTGDSDVVAVLMHLGYYAHYLAQPPAQIAEIRALLKLLPPQDKYPSKARFVKSRAWCSTIEGCSFQVESCWLVTRSGSSVELQPSIDEVPAPYPSVHAQFNRQMTTRSTGRHGKQMGQEVSVQFNLCNEPWLKYTLPAIADRGLKPSMWTSSRLLDDVLLLETSSTRYQIARTGEAAGEARSKDLYSLSRCKTAMPMGMLRKVGLPLPSDEVEVLEEGLGWEDLQWGVGVLSVRSRKLDLKRMHFMPLTKDAQAA